MSLHPDLQASIEMRGIPWIAHPLCHLPYTPAEVENYNAVYVKGQEVSSEALLAGDYKRWVYTFAKPYRLEAIHSLVDAGLLKEPQTYWSILSDEWKRSDTIWRDLEAWTDLWTRGVRSRHYAMEPEDKEWFKTLPRIITIYRGCPTRDIRGLSWTTDREMAIWFAKRHTQDRRGFVASGQVEKAKVLAAFEIEREIVVEAAYIFDVVLL